MAETVQHTTLDKDPSLAAIKTLQDLDLSTLSFVQLQNLKSTLKEVLGAAEIESSRRAAEDNSGDTVQVTAHQPDD